MAKEKNKEYACQAGEIIEDMLDKLQNASNLRFLMFKGSMELFGDFEGRTKLIEKSIYKIKEEKNGIQSVKH